MPTQHMTAREFSVAIKDTTIILTPEQRISNQSYTESITSTTFNYQYVHALISMARILILTNE